MKTPTFAIFLLSTYGVGYCQTTAPTGSQPTIIHGAGDARPPRRVLSAQELTTERIKNMIRSEQPIANMTVPLLARMGDGAAAEILNVLKSRGPLGPSEKRNVVQMLHKAFEDPRAIRQAANRTPQATLALLGQLDAATVDFTLKTQIADTRQFALNATASAN